MARSQGNTLLIAKNGEKILQLTPNQRSRHLYVVGSTGSGKSKFLEYLIRQDIVNWRRSECGLLLLDPHGAIYDGLMKWLTSRSYIYNRPIIPIDLRRDDWVVAYNLLREREQAQASVVIDNFIGALAHVWGSAGTDATPRLARIAATVLQALYEHKLTIIEAARLLEYESMAFRAEVARNVTDEITRKNLERLNTLRPNEHEAQVESTLNRFQRLSRNKLLRATFGQTEVSLDFRRVIEEGAIVLVSLATEGGVVSKEDADTFATLMLADLWTAAKERGKDTGGKPMYCYIDEFQTFVSPTIAENLDEARGFGLHLTLAHQYPSQLIQANKEYGQRIYESVMENARSKVVFSLSLREKNLTPLADWLSMGMFDPDKVKHDIYSRKVMDYEEETRTITSRGESHGSTRSDMRGSGTASGNVHITGSSGGVDAAGVLSPTGWSTGEAQTSSDSSTSGHGQSESDGYSESESEVPVFLPIFGEELSSRQYVPLDEQRFLAEQRIMKQKDRHATARFLGMEAPVEIRTVDVRTPRVSEKMLETYRLEQLAKWPFVLPYEEAQKRVEKRTVALNLSSLAKETEPATHKRLVNKPRVTIRKKENAGEIKNHLGLELQERDLAIFRGLFESRLMTLDHIARLYFTNQYEAAKKRIQRLKAERFLRERTRRVYEPSILHLSHRAFDELSRRGHLKDYPRFAWNQLEDRAKVSDLTLRHELAVLDVKTSLSCAIRNMPDHELLEFSTWPALYQFEAAQPPRPGVYGNSGVLIKPDGFMRLYEHTQEGETFEHFLFLEVDRSTEPRDTLALRTYGYQHYYRRGGLAVRYGHTPEDYKDFPFRVLIVLQNEERRNNMAERLLQNTPPVLTMVWLTTFQEIITDPLGAIWMRPVDYREITKGTPYDPTRERTGAYRRQPEREEMVAVELKKLRLFE